MFAVVLVYVAVLGLCAGALLEGGAAFARVSARHAAQHYVEIALVRARAALLSDVAQQVASGVAALSAPAALGPAPVCVTSPCAFTSRATFALAGTLASTQNANVSAANLQTLPAISEGRVAATIAETITSSSGTPLAARTQYVTLRILKTPPYVALDGLSDAAASRDVANEADAGGSTGAQAPAGSMDPADTRVHALVRCVDGGSGACNGQTYVSADPANAPAQTPWFNANAQWSGWSL